MDIKIIQAMEPISTRKIIEDENYIHQIKWDGIRILSYVQEGKIHLLTKRGQIRNVQYVELRQLSRIKGLKYTVFDGEVIAMNQGKPSFQKILIRDRTMNEHKIKNLIKTIPVYYVIFDIPFYCNLDLRKEPLHKRQRLLNDLITPSDRIFLAENYDDPKDLYALVKENNYEGIVSKNIHGGYIGGKLHKSWFKYKLARRMLCVLCGIRLTDEGRAKSLHIGIHIEGELTYVGTIYSGLKQQDLKLLDQYKDKLSTEHAPFKQGIIDVKKSIWFQPLITCWISFMEWTDQGVVRHGKILGFSEKRCEEADGTEFVE
ncbi:MAG: DNA ligase [Eubacteriales bacterium]